MRKQEGKKRRNGEQFSNVEYLIFTEARRPLRQLGSKRIYTDEGIVQATEQLAKSENGKNIRRMARGSG